jgi:undecaprenyl-diphosphatase
MQIWQAILLGLIEGITEFLPVSSTGHLILVSKILALPQTDFVASFEIIIQAFAILAVIIVYLKKIISSFKQSKLLIIAYLPTAFIGFMFYPIVKQLLHNHWITIVALIGGGIIFWILEQRMKNRQSSNTEVSFRQAFIIGIGQSCSMIPGVSRSAASIFSGMLVGLDRKQAVEFSFLLAIPTILSATLYDLLKTRMVFTSHEIILIGCGGLTAFIAALCSINWFLRYISHHSFVPFGVYRIVAGIMFAIFMI